MNCGHVFDPRIKEILRGANGYTKRANSVDPLYSSELDLNVKIKYCKDFYERLGLPVIYKITDDFNLCLLDNKELSYSKKDETSVRIMDLCRKYKANNSSVVVSYQILQRLINEYIIGICINSSKLAVLS